MLYDAIEKLAAARGAAQLTVEASDTASDFFAQRGFIAAAAQHRFGRRRMAEQHHHEEEAAAKEPPHERPDTPFPRHWLYYIALKSW